MRVFCGFYETGRGDAAISVSQPFVSDAPMDAEHQEHFQGCDAFRELLAGRAAALGSAEDRRLYWRHARNMAGMRRARRDMERRWAEGG